MSLRIYLKFIILDFIPLLFLQKKSSILRFFYTFFVKKRGISPSDLRLIKLSYKIYIYTGFLSQSTISGVSFGFGFATNPYLV